MADLSETDLQHLHTFPPHKRAELLKSILAMPATQQRVLSSNTEYERALMKLHQDGYGLIDFQPLETVLTSVWYRNTSKLLGLAKSETVVMLVWEPGSQGVSGITASMNAWEM